MAGQAIDDLFSNRGLRKPGFVRRRGMIEYTFAQVRAAPTWSPSGEDSASCSEEPFEALRVSRAVQSRESRPPGNRCQRPATIWRTRGKSTSSTAPWMMQCTLPRGLTRIWMGSSGEVSMPRSVSHAPRVLPSGSQ